VRPRRTLKVRTFLVVVALLYLAFATFVSFLARPATR
jgi:hypothetical protein